MNAAIIIPAYNAAKFIAEAIESALAQTRRASQIIVVDDGSTDNTATEVNKFGDAVMLLQQKNAGVSAARNNGSSQTTAEWLLFLDADDRLRPDALARLLAHANETTLGAIYGLSVDFDELNVKHEHGNDTMQGPPPAGTKCAFWKAPIATPGAVIVRREVLERVGGWNPRFNTTADRDLWCRIGTVAEFGFVPEVIVERRVHDSNMSSDKNRGRRQAVEVQLAFLEWCSARGVDTAFLETSETEIFERNAKRAIDERAFDAAMWIANEAEQRGIQSSAIARARRLAGMTGLARDMEIRVREFIGL
jgi:glycosyltransferase involved in cell wall biosynthesis